MKTKKDQQLDIFTVLIKDYRKVEEEEGSAEKFEK